ncbi:hypothetical protein ACFL0W_03145 [Nanoarchaeota archaeon]
MEYKICVDNLEFSYEGVFDLQGLHGSLSKWAKENGYNLDEKTVAEKVSEKGRIVYREIELKKEIERFFSFLIKLKFNISKMKDVTMKKNGKPAKLQQGEIDFIMIGFTESWWENRWEQKNPLYYFITELIDKFVYKFKTRHHYFAGPYENQVRKDCFNLQKEIQSYLNLHRLKVEKQEPEKKVIP